MIMTRSGSTEKLHGKELHEIYSSASIIRTTTSRRIKVAGYVTRKGGKISIRFDIPISVYRDIITNYSQQDATSLDLFIFTDALHVSGGSSAHHQEHITVHTDSGIVNQYCC
jgi:hypothetical protein